MKRRQLTPWIDELAFDRRKMAFISGPRQCGKTTLAKQMLKARGDGCYHSWDRIEFRREWVKSPSSLVPACGKEGERPLWVLDELHKARGWKRALKGVYDTLEDPVDILVTGSARLNVYRRGSDSLLGRYLHFRLHPFTVRELSSKSSPAPDDTIQAITLQWRRPRATQTEAFDILLRYGAFPEPFFEQSERLGRLWRNNRVERLIREDLRDMSRLRELSQVEMLASLLPERVGSLLSVQSLCVDLEVTHRTVSSWLEHLNELFYVFWVKPYTTHVRRSIRKAGKLYMWDHSEVDNPGSRFENAVACHLLKACHFWTDTGEGRFDLRFLRSKDGQEVDFLVTRDGAPWLAVEVKLSDVTPSSQFKAFAATLAGVTKVQVVRDSGQHEKWTTATGPVTVLSADAFLSALP